MSSDSSDLEIPEVVFGNGTQTRELTLKRDHEHQEPEDRQSKQPRNLGSSGPNASQSYDLSSSMGIEPRVQHEMNAEELTTYKYPINKPVRDYQRNMIRKALVRNIICAIPTGLGKTFIASVVMWNWYRWTKRAKILFMAPTRPLVTQQVQNFLEITGVSINDTCVLLPDIVTRARREEMWASKRVFFATPQTIENDLHSGHFNARDVVCIIVDEAHRATGNHSYVNVVKEIHRATDAVRIIALTATPSGRFEGVQDIIDNLHISSTEIRTEESIDVKQYTHRKKMNRVLVEPDQNMKTLFKLCQELLQPWLQEFCNLKIVHTVDPLNVHHFALQTNLKQYMATHKGSKYVFPLRAKATLLQPILYALGLLQTHGIYPFYTRVNEVYESYKKASKPGKNISALCKNPVFKTILKVCEEMIYKAEDGQQRNPDFLSHPKMAELKRILEDFFRLNGADARCIIFTDYRETALEIEWVLQSLPQAQCSLFVGQQSSSMGVKGMTQKQQHALLEKFMVGDINVLIATSVAEEGLDIAQVDLIICYDQSKSPIRNIQRMGRTGRAREGEIYMLMTAKENKKLDLALMGHKWVESRINENGERKVQQPDKLHLKYRESCRILPPKTVQRYTEVVVEPPPENKVDDVLQALKPKTALGRKPKKAKKGSPGQPAFLGFVDASTGNTVRDGSGATDVGPVAPGLPEDFILSSSDDER